MHGAFTLRGRTRLFQWAALLCASLVFISLLELIHLPAAVLLGAMAAAILASYFESDLVMPATPYVIAQGLVSCLVARSIGADILATMTRQWPILLFCVGSVIVFSTGLGGLLARWKILPGTTAVWGSSPGAATVMVLMSEAYGADSRLVAFMQYLRVVLVALTASVVARLWGLHPSTADMIWFPVMDPLAVAETLALAVAGSLVGAKTRIPAGALLLPMFIGMALSSTHLLVISLPPALMVLCYAFIGWSLGVRFTRATIFYAARVLPRVLLSISVLIASCGLLAYLLHLVTGVDALTAYLATSPGGADSVAIIAAASKVDLPFVMAMQTARFLLVILIGPSLARMVAKWAQK